MHFVEECTFFCYYVYGFTSIDRKGKRSFQCQQGERKIEMLTFICYPKCSTCQKAKALLNRYYAQYETRNIKTDNPSYDELKQWLVLSELPIRKFFNTSGLAYKSLGLKDKLTSMSEDECLQLLATDGMLVKRPLLVDEYRTLVGFKPEEWESVFYTI